MSFKDFNKTVTTDGTAQAATFKSQASGSDQVPSVAIDQVANAGLPCITPGTSQKVAFDASQQSAAITGTVVRVVSTTDCHLAFGANPTAVADGTCWFLPAGSVEYFRITSGSKIAAVKDSAAGTLFITPAA